LLQWLPEPQADLFGAVAPPAFIAEPAGRLSKDSHLARLYETSGVNVIRALEVLRGNENLYLKLLRRFIELHIDDMNTLRHCLETGDLDTARRVCHTLKGTGATLGLDHLAELAHGLSDKLKNLQDGARQGLDLHEEMAEVSKVFAVLTEVVKLNPMVTAANQARQHDDVQARVLEEFAALLEQHNTEAIALFEGSSAVMHTTFGNRMPEVEQLIRGFCFSEVLALLRQVMK
jgi:HPt (histidine-containing phosphotransfer) domain-containing protein